MAKRRKKAAGFILDCSLAVAWCFPDEKAPYPDAVLDSLGKGVAVVPASWSLEVANALLIGERRKRCTQADVTAWTGFLTSLPIRVDEQTGARALSDTLSLARTHGLSAYDAAYLELALRHGFPLASLDTPLNHAFRAVGGTRYVP